MKNWKRMLALLLSVALLVSMCSMLASCGDEEAAENSDTFEALKDVFDGKD